MSRSGYDYDYDCGCEQWSWVMWRGAVESAIRGKRGQLLLMEMLTALDALPVKRLVADELVDVDIASFSHWGMYEYDAVCAIGAVGKKRGVDLKKMDSENYSMVADTFNIAEAMVREIEWINDEAGVHRETPEERFVRVRGWVAMQIREFGQ